MRFYCLTVIAFALCAGAMAGLETFPVRSVMALSPLTLGTAISRYQVLVQVPEEPPKADIQRLGFFTGLDLYYEWSSRAPAQAGLMVMWNAEHHWRAMPAQRFCKANDCWLSYEDDVMLSVVPGDIVFLNVSGKSGEDLAYMEATLPLKNQTSGIAKHLQIEQINVRGAFASIHGEAVGSCVNTMPQHDSWMQRASFTTAEEPEKEISLNWNIIKEAATCGQKLIPYASMLITSWWDGQKH